MKQKENEKSAVNLLVAREFLIVSNAVDSIKVSTLLVTWQKTLQNVNKIWKIICIRNDCCYRLKMNGNYVFYCSRCIFCVACLLTNIDGFSFALFNLINSFFLFRPSSLLLHNSFQFFVCSERNLFMLLFIFCGQFFFRFFMFCLFCLVAGTIFHDHLLIKECVC